MRRLVEFSPASTAELAALPAHIKKPVAHAIDLLSHQADLRTEQRHPMEGRFAPHWEARVGDHRIYYLFGEGIVTVVAIRHKGKKRLKEIWRPTRPRAA
jgi:mRNA-degrading endonuclease RelE of RelBE toxin-antitoxin system